MAYKVNAPGVSHAKKLIKAGEIDKNSGWSFSADDGNALLGDDKDWKAYSKWFLAIDPDAADETKAKYHYPFGKDGKIYRSAVIAAKQRAAQQKEDDIETAASDLLDEIDKGNDDNNKADGKKSLGQNTQYRTALISGLDMDNKRATLSFSSEEPVNRWFGTEILSHDAGAANLVPLQSVGAVLRNHDPNQIVAKPVDSYVDALAKKGKATIQFVDTPLSQATWEEVKSGLLRGVSVGYMIDDYDELDENDPQAPGIRATKWSVHEISLTPVPADATVGVGRSKINKEGDQQMEDKNSNVISIKDAKKAEKERVMALRELGKAHNIEDAKIDAFIENDIELEQARIAILDELAQRQKAVGAGPRVSMGATPNEQWRDTVTDALVAKIERKTASLPQEAMKYTQKSLFEIAQESLFRIGKSVDGSKLEVAQRAIIESTSDFPALMLNVANKTLINAYAQFPTTYQLWTRIVPASDFKPMTRVKFGSFPTLPLVSQGQDFPFAKINDSYTQYSIGKYGEIFSLTRETIINDDLGAFSQVPMRFGQAAKRTIDKTVYALINANPSISTIVNGSPVTANVFSTTLGTLGTPGVISMTTLDEAHKLFMAQTDISGNPISVAPKYLVVPPALRSTANSWMRSNFVPGVYNEVNTYASYAEIIESPFLSSGNGGSDTAWYLLGDPGIVDTVEVAFLDGREAPVVEMWPSQANDGVSFKVRLDFGAAVIDHRGMFMNAG